MAKLACTSTVCIVAISHVSVSLHDGRVMNELMVIIMLSTRVAKACTVHENILVCVETHEMVVIVTCTYIQPARPVRRRLCVQAYVAREKPRRANVVIGFIAALYCTDYGPRCTVD